MQRTERDPTAYLDSLSDDRRESMKLLDRMISEVMTGQPRALWEGRFWGGSDQMIIGYGNLVTVRSGVKSEWFMVGLALQKRYISLYVNAVQDGKYVAEQYGSRLGKVKVGKASISFTDIHDIDLGVLREVLAIAHDALAAA
jgi:hypothetical protein